MVKSNWHTHTYRCGHARGKDEEYVIEAIKAGVKRLGFSDHAPYPGVEGEGIRMNYELLEDYYSSIKELKEKYKDQIEIYLGLEIEYDDNYLDLLKQYRKELDYLILGQHGLYNALDEKSYFIQTEKELDVYYNSIEKACELGLIDCIAHPDVCLWSYPEIDDAVINLANKIADLSLKYNVPVEANCGSGVLRGLSRYIDGFRYPYPTNAFFDVFKEKGCKVIIGLDIHNPELFKTEEYVNRVKSVLEKSACEYDEDYNLIEAARERKKKFLYI